MGQVALGVWTPIAPRTNRFRAYRLKLGRDLWDRTCLVKVWGRIGKRPRRLFHWPRDSQELARLLQETIRRRGRHGYRVG